METKLCPFCGSKATVRRTFIRDTGYVAWDAGCRSKSCRINPNAHVQNLELPKNEGWNTPIGKLSKRIKQMAIEAWNKRKEGS